MLESGYGVVLRALLAVGLLVVTTVSAAGDIGYSTYYCSTSDAGNGNLNELVFQGAKINYIETKTLADPTDVTDWHLCYIDGQLNSATCQEYGQGEFTVGEIVDDKGCKKNTANTCDEDDYSHPLGEYVSWPANVTGSEGEIILFDDDPNNSGAGVIDYLHYCLDTDCDKDDLTILNQDGDEALGSGGDPSTDEVTCGNVVDISYNKGELATGGAAVLARIDDGTGEWVNSGDPDSPIYGASEGSAGRTNSDLVETELDHIELSHDSTGLTCQGEPVKVRACSDAACDSLYTEEVTVDFTSPKSGWAPDPVSFSGGEAVVDLTHTVAETVALDAEATSPTAADDLVCINRDGGTACQVSFSEVGIIIDGNASDSDPESEIQTQIAGKPSNITPNGAGQRVRVVRTDDKTGACIPAVGNESLEATFSYQTPTASQGLQDNTISIAAATDVDLTTAGAGETVTLDFDANGAAPFHFTSLDAGRYALQVSMEIPVVDSGGTATGQTIAASDTSNGFVVRPLAVFADGDGNPKAQDADGPVFRKAGEPFDVAFRSLRWSSSRDGDQDGLWDACTDTTGSEPGTGYARVPEWSAGQPGGELKAPGAGNPGVLAYGNGDAVFGAGASLAQATDVSYSEVGIIQLYRDGLNAFLGESVEVCSPYIGRFTPNHFIVGDPYLTNRVEAGCSPSSTFTYLDEELRVGYRLLAKNTVGQPTKNYIGAFAKFDGTGAVGFEGTALNYTIGVVHDPGGAEETTLGSRIEVTSAAQVGVWTDGEGLFDIDLNVERDSDPDGPFHDTRFGVAVSDADGVTFEPGDLDLDADADGTEDHVELASSELRFGRLTVYSAYGSELHDLKMPLAIEYYDGSAFQANTADDCTNLVETDFELTGFSGNLESGETTVTAVDLENGEGTLTLAAPGQDNDGEVDVSALLGPTEAAMPWLQYDWDDIDQGNDGDFFDDNPSGHATFGIYSGDQHRIYLREQY